MPTYEYACRSCGGRLEVVQSFTDDPLTECPTCQGSLRKVFSPVGITFKGSGFYKTDSRSGSSRSSSGSSSGGSSDAGSGSAKSSEGGSGGASSSGGSSGGDTAKSTSSSSD